MDGSREPRIPSEQELRDRFALRVESFDHAGIQLELVVPASAEALIDEAAFELDERLPYWAELWPSARALGRYLAERSFPAGTRVVELGCGVGLPSLTLAARGHPVLATDYESDALALALANAARNRIRGVDVALLDWREPTGLGPFDLVLAADVLYELRNAVALAALLPRLLAPRGMLLLADPGRAYLTDFRSAIQKNGWRLERSDERTELSAPISGAVSRVTIFTVARRV